MRGGGRLLAIGRTRWLAHVRAMTRTRRSAHNKSPRLPRPPTESQFSNKTCANHCLCSKSPLYLALSIYGNRTVTHHGKGGLPNRALDSTNGHRALKRCRDKSVLSRQRAYRKRFALTCRAQYPARRRSPTEVLVFNRNKGRTLSGCRCHVSSKRFSSSRFIRLDRNLYVVGIELCALQAATYLPFRELVEYYFELCGAYSLGTSSGIDVSYTERPQLTSTADLKRFFNTLNACDGLIAARKTIKCVRDGCRSPMETAFVMMLTLPKRDGGLGIRTIETDYEVKVPSNARALTRRTKFYMDAYLKRSRTISNTTDSITTRMRGALSTRSAKTRLHPWGTALSR